MSAPLEPRLPPRDPAFERPRNPGDFESRVLRFDALGAMDGLGFAVSPASLLVECVPPDAGRSSRTRWRARLLAAGSPSEVDAHQAWSSRGPGVRRYRLPRAVLIPGLVNAHTHLDLTHIGPRAFEPAGGFSGWINLIRAERLADPAQIAASVWQGLRKSWAGGVVAVGDIAGAVNGRPSLAAARPLLESAMSGVSFVEFFSIGSRLAALDQLEPEIVRLGQDQREASGARLGVQPHAPYSVSRDAYQQAIDLAKRCSAKVATHLAESPEERELVVCGTGPFRKLLEGLGLWSPEVARSFAMAASPVQHLGLELLRGLDLVVHLNNVSDEDIRLLAASGTGVAYCPRASAYFQHAGTFGEHRYRDMIRAGVPVVLGTDSIVNLDTSDRISPLDDARLLFKRDGFSASRLLSMCTDTAARVVGLPAGGFVCEPGNDLAGLVAVEVVEPGAQPPESVQRGAIGNVLLGSEWCVPNLLFGGTNFG